MSLPLGVQRAQLVDLGLEFGDGLFEVEIGAHVIRHQINIRKEAISAKQLRLANKQAFSSL